MHHNIHYSVQFCKKNKKIKTESNIKLLFYEKINHKSGGIYR